MNTCGEKMRSAMRFGFGGRIEGDEPIEPQPKPEVAQAHPVARRAAR